MISNDTSRCLGSHCPERDSCLRYLTVAHDKLMKYSVRLSYSDDMCGVNGLFDGVYKIELENK